MSKGVVRSRMARAALGAVLLLTPTAAASPTSLGSFVGVAEAAEGGGAQAMTATATWNPPRTPDGQPDMGGILGWRTGRRVA